MTTIELNPREFWSLAIGGAILCFTAGVILACLVVAVVVLPLRDDDRPSRMGRLIAVWNDEETCLAEKSRWRMVEQTNPTA
jgi:hypothetical protein